MLDNKRLVRDAAAFKRDASREFDKAVKALVDLAWEKGQPTVNFLWESDPELDGRANAVLRGMSDNLAARAKELAGDAVRNALGFYDFDDPGEDGGDGWDEATLLFRLDMQGSHLKDLLEIWIALAAVHHIGKSALRVLVSRYLNNPFASPLWRGLPKDAIHWGSGYARNIAEQLAVIGQDAIISASRLAEWRDAVRRGARYYIRRRGSSYDCYECDAMANKPIPVEVPFEVPHPRCCCYPEYFFGENP